MTHDLYVLKSHTELALSTAGTLCPRSTAPQSPPELSPHPGQDHEHQASL